VMLPRRQFWSVQPPEDAKGSPKPEKNGDGKAVVPPRRGVYTIDFLEVRGRNRMKFGVNPYEMRKCDISDFFRVAWPNVKHTDVPGTFSTLKRLLTAGVHLMKLQRRVFRVLLGQFVLALDKTEQSYVFIIKWWKRVTDRILATGSAQSSIKYYKGYALDMRCFLLKRRATRDLIHILTRIIQKDGCEPAQRMISKWAS